MAKDTAPNKPQKTLASAFNCKTIQTTGEIFEMSSCQKTVFECLKESHAQDFLIALPINGLGQRMSAVEYRAILKYYLMIPMFPVDEPCPVCKKACLDKFGKHAFSCKEMSGFKYRHDLVRDALWDVL